jgi:hypothetical protein
MSIKALQRTAASRSCSNRRASWPPSLSLGRSPLASLGENVAAERELLTPRSARGEPGARDRCPFGARLSCHVRCLFEHKHVTPL